MLAADVVTAVNTPLKAVPRVCRGYEMPRRNHQVRRAVTCFSHDRVMTELLPAPNTNNQHPNEDRLSSKNDQFFYFLLIRHMPATSFVLGSFHEDFGGDHDHVGCVRHAVFYTAGAVKTSPTCVYQAVQPRSGDSAGMPLNQILGKM